MASSNDALITKVCVTFPAAFGIDNGALAASVPFKYYLDGVLGAGTSGTVVYARRVRDGMPFAVKIMDVGGYTNEDRMRASGEICCLLSCNFFSIVRCHEDYVLTDPKNPENVQMVALVLDYANAGDLRQEIRNRARAGRPFVEHEAGLLFIQILLAVHHVHSKRMIHRDIKSANILLSNNGLVKLGDFGFSKHYANTVSDDVGRTFCGTPYYVAPEIWRRKPYSKKADMFSLGVLLYELLTLKRPFDGPEIEDVMHKSLAGQYPPLPSHISPEMTNLVTALLSNEPKKRPSSKVLLNTPICKLYMSVVQDLVLNGDGDSFTPGQASLIMHQIQQTKEELQNERRMRGMSLADALKNATPYTLQVAGAPSSPNQKGYILFGGVLKKQGSDLLWKKRYICIYGTVSPEALSGKKDDAWFTTLDLIQSVSQDTLQQQSIATPFPDLEDVFPVPNKYTGSEAEHSFAVAFRNGKRFLLDAQDDKERDLWMQTMQSFLRIGDED